MTQPAPPPLERTPPQDIETEMCVLGAIMLEPKHAYSIVADILTKESFYLNGHGVIFELMGDLHRRGIPPDSDMVLDELRGRNLLEKVGGAGVVLNMLNSVASAANVYYHAKKISEKAHLRATIRACTQILEECYRQEMSIDEVLDQADRAVCALSAGAHDSRAQHISDSLVEIWKDIGDRDDEIKADLAAGRTPATLFTGLPTGFVDLDTMVRGLRDAELTVIGGHVSEGKTSLALSMVRHLALQQELPVAVFSLEMNEATLSERMLSMGTKHFYQNALRGMPVTSFETPNFSQADWNVLTQACNSLLTAPIYWVCHPKLTIDQIAAELRQLKRRRDIRAAFVDYTQLITPVKSYGNRVVDVGNISRGLKALARGSSLPIVALSQFGRQYVGQKPALYQLRESGDIAADADTVLMIWRKDLHDDKYKADRKAKADQRLMDKLPPQVDLPEVDLVIGKNRNGPLGTVTMRFFSDLTLFLSASRL